MHFGYARLIAGVLAASLTVGACSNASQRNAIQTNATPPTASASTARGLVDALADSGFNVPNPLDTTRQICPRLGCLQSVVCDTLRVSSFRTASLARRSAVPGVDAQVGIFVVRFAPPMTEIQKAGYWRRIRQLIADGHR